MALTQAVPFKPLDSAETFKACALFGLYLLAEAGSSGSQSLDLRDMWRYGCPKKSPEWDSDDELWSDSEGLSSSDFASTTWRALLSMLWCMTSQAKSGPFSWRIGNFRGWL